VTSEDPEVSPEVAELPLLPYLLPPGEDQDRPQDDGGDVPHNADG